MGVCYRLPNQDQEADAIVCKQLGEVTQLQLLVLMGGFSLSDVWWKYNTAERKQSVCSSFTQEDDNVELWYQKLTIIVAFNVKSQVSQAYERQCVDIYLIKVHA